MLHNIDGAACDMKPGRRKFLLWFSWAGLGLSCISLFAAVLRFFWPRVSSRPDMSVPVGFPEDYRPGKVVYHPGLKLFIIRDQQGFLSLSARCTHLGCIVAWNPDHRMFLCPCHGGKFDAEGRNVDGPPPRPLDVLALRLDDNGILIVDRDIIIKRHKGSAPRFKPARA